MMLTSFVIFVDRILYRSKDDFVKKLYFAYFKMKLGDQEKSSAPHIVCETSIANLISWSLGRRKRLAFGIPMIWRELQNHISDCYFCIAETKAFKISHKTGAALHQYPCTCFQKSPGSLYGRQRRW